jgi:hypothetical protein
MSLASVRMSVSSPTAPITIGTDGTTAVTLNVTVANNDVVGHDPWPAASQVVTAFWAPPPELAATSILAKRQLFAFERTVVPAGETRIVSFSVSASSFEVADVRTGDRVVYSGTFNVTFTDGAGRSAGVPVTLTGPRVVVEPFPKS